MTRGKVFVGILLASGILVAALAPGRDEVLGSYTTPLAGRTPGQRENAERAARAIDGTVIEPGGEFSFDHTVGSWTPDRGFVLAPVSYDGELVVDWGGGVCQTSSTLYNAALVAGLQILERHRHNWAPGYVPAGRDAAVAQYKIDLRLRNPYRFPVKLRARVRLDGLCCEVLGKGRGPVAVVEVDRLSRVRPTTVSEVYGVAAAGGRKVARVQLGERVLVYRRFLRGPRAGQRELVSRDSYPAATILVGKG